MITLSKLWVKLRNRKYRKAFVAAQLKRGVPFQIRAMRKKLGWSQEALAQKAGLTQGVISRAEDPNYGNLTFNTVLEIANGFDVAFIGRFVPFSELGQWSENLSEQAVQVATFQEEDRPFESRVESVTAETGLLPSFFSVFSEQTNKGILGIIAEQALGQVPGKPPQAAIEKYYESEGAA